MLLTTVTESDPIYQFCAECVDAWITTQDDRWFDAITEDVLPDDEAIKVLRAEGKDQGGDVGEQLARDGANLHWNPFTAAKMVADLGDFPSRARGIGVHQPQVRSVQSLLFWNHKNTKRALLAFGASALLPDESITGDALGLYGSAKGIQAIYNKLKNRPKSVIAKKIASLRKLYQTWLHRSKIERDDKTSGLMKTIATNIMILIDKLLELLQKGADKVSQIFD